MSLEEFIQKVEQLSTEQYSLSYLEENGKMHNS